MISLIISTRDRAPQLERALSYIQNIQFEGALEVIVVNNGSKDHTSVIISDFAAASKFPTREVFELTPGLGTARNTGLRAATGEIVVFTDDDCYVDPDFVTEISYPFKWPGIGYVGGRITLFDETDIRLTVRYDERPLTYYRNSYVPSGDIQGACMAFRRDALGGVGNFDPLFGAGSFFPAEDLDAVLRVSKAGYYGIYWPDAHVRHHHGRKASDTARLEKSYAVGRGAILSKLVFNQRAFRMAFQMISIRARNPISSSLYLYWEFLGFIKYLFVSRGAK